MAARALLRQLHGIDDSVAGNAKKIVDHLLENELVRACRSCEKEFGVHDPKASHGYCKRHLIDSYRGMENNFGADYSTKIASLEARPDTDFPPDLAKQRPALAQESTDARCQLCTPNPDGTKSYSLCKRHTVQWAQKQGLTPDQIEDLVTGTETGGGFPPDLNLDHRRPTGAMLHGLSPEDRLKYAPGISVE